MPAAGNTAGTGRRPRGLPAAPSAPGAAQRKPTRAKGSPRTRAVPELVPAPMRHRNHLWRSLELPLRRSEPGTQRKRHSGLRCKLLESRTREPTSGPAPANATGEHPRANTAARTPSEMKQLLRLPSLTHASVSTLIGWAAVISALLWLAIIAVM